MKPLLNICLTAFWLMLMAWIFAATDLFNSSVGNDMLCLGAVSLIVSLPMYAFSLACINHFLD